MNRISVLFLLWVSFIFYSPFVLAQEGILTEPASALQTQARPSLDSFNIVVTSDGRLTVHPGLVFTEGEEEPGTQLPSLASDPKPIVYPKWAIDQGWQGKMVIAVEILTDGSVGSYQVMHSTGHEVLDEATTQTIRGWEFHPALKADGQAFRTCIQIPITFQLENE